MIVYGWENPARRLCPDCNTDRLKKVAAEKPKKEIKPRTPLKRQPLKKKSTHGHVANMMKAKELNKKIWAERPHVCVECAANLPDHPDGIFFSHLHTKASHPKSRHDPDNIVLHCPDCHHEWEFGGRREDRMPKTLKIFQDYNPNLSQ